MFEQPLWILLVNVVSHGNLCLHVNLLQMMMEREKCCKSFLVTAGERSQHLKLGFIYCEDSKSRIIGITAGSNKSGKYLMMKAFFYSLSFKVNMLVKYFPFISDYSIIYWVWTFFFFFQSSKLSIFICWGQHEYFLEV